MPVPWLGVPMDSLLEIRALRQAPAVARQTDVFDDVL
jgi:hypothetical protein